MNQKTLIITLSILIAGCSPVNPITRAFAEEIVISSSGSDSSSHADVTVSSNTTVAQSNTTNVNNDTKATLDTGNNSASNNNGNTTIQTGDATANTSVETSANSSVVAVNNCCSQNDGDKILISGNGSNSQNSADVSHTLTTTTTVNQNAVITNSITGTATTGNNIANDNNGNVTIKTGAIHVSDTIKTGPVNIASIAVGVPQFGLTLKIDGNGNDSVNTANFSENLTIENTVFNHADIFNTSLWNLVSGGNTANRNNGDVLIATGNIDQTTSIVNGPINASTIEEKCCSEKTVPTPTPPTPTPGPQQGKGNSDNGGGGGNSGSSNGSSLAAAGSILPATGQNWIFFALLANSLMLLLGMVLRLRSGRSPAYKFRLAL